ncbi:MAG TPA: hypothetical protein VGM92_04005 [Candidatus Kapabacteria bacterium]|jgi:hypothetical protein
MTFTFSRTPKRLPIFALAAFSLFLSPLVALAQAKYTSDPVSDSLRNLTLRNEKMYRMLNAMDDKGSSYEFTNITAWKITDDDLKNQIIKVYTAQYGTKQLKNFNINNVYVFSAPSGPDHYVPFHILFMGQHVQPTDSTGESGEEAMFGSHHRAASTADQPVAFKGIDVIRMMARQPALLENINAIQGDLVELPGDIAPRGVQILKNPDERYVFHEMFTGFYSKQQMIDEQNYALGAPAPWSDLIVTDTTAAVIPLDPDETQYAPVEQLNYRAFHAERTIDLAVDHLTANITRGDQLEFQIGDPEVGLPFWSSGEARLWLTMRNQIGTESDFSIGFDFPNFGLGNVNGSVFQPRYLSGFYGGSVAAYFAGIDFFSAFNMPIAFNFSVFPAGGSNSSIIDNGAEGETPTPIAGGPTTVAAGQTFYRTSFIGQIYIPFIVQLDPANFMQFSAGIGIDNVKLSWIPKNDSIAEAYGYGTSAGGSVQDLLYNGKTYVSTPFTPHVGIEYVNHRANKFGLDFQYDHLFTFGGWLELIPDHLRIEASYTAPLVRDPLPYEPPYFFMITPRIYF